MSGLSRRSSYVYAGLEGTIRGRNIVCPRIDVKCIFRVPLLSYASSGGRSRDSKDDRSCRSSFSLSLLLTPSQVSIITKFPSFKIELCALNARKIPRHAFFFCFFFLSSYKRKEIHRYRSVITRISVNTFKQTPRRNIFTAHILS